MKLIIVFIATLSLGIARNLPTDSPKTEPVTEQEQVPAVPEDPVAVLSTEDAVADVPKTDEEAIQAPVEPEAAIEAPAVAVPPLPDYKVAICVEDLDESSEVSKPNESVDTDSSEVNKDVSIKSATEGESEPVEGEPADPVKRINLGIGQSASNAYSPYGYSRSKVGAASLNIGLQNTYFNSYRPLAQYGQSYGTSQRTGPWAPQTWGNAGAGRYGAYGHGGYRGGYGQTQSNAFNIQQRIPVAPGLALLTNLNTDKEKAKSETGAEASKSETEPEAAEPAAPVEVSKAEQKEADVV